MCILYYIRTKILIVCGSTFLRCFCLFSVCRIHVTLDNFTIWCTAIVSAPSGYYECSLDQSSCCDCVFIEQYNKYIHLFGIMILLWTLCLNPLFPNSKTNWKYSVLPDRNQYYLCNEFYKIHSIFNAKAKKIRESTYANERS